MSIVLATDTFDTLRPVLGALRRQTVCDQLEVVIVCPAAALGHLDEAALSTFGRVQVVDVQAPLSLPVARAAGVRAASAPIVFVGETHCFPQRDMVEVILATFTDERCAVVVPAILNANPTSALSWASYLTDYGTWGAGRAAGPIDHPLVYNGAYRRSALLTLSQSLDDVLDSNSEELWPLLKAQGYHARFEPAARTDHVNAIEVGAMLRIRFCTGALIGKKRARRWTAARRILYVTASVLIPLVLVSRTRSIVPFGAPGVHLPRGTMLGVAVGAIAKTIGEVMGYLGIEIPWAEPRLTENELHKIRYAHYDPRTLLA